MNLKTFHTRHMFRLFPRGSADAPLQIVTDPVHLLHSRQRLSYCPPEQCQRLSARVHGLIVPLPLSPSREAGIQSFGSQ